MRATPFISSTISEQEGAEMDYYRCSLDASDVSAIVIRLCKSASWPLPAHTSRPPSPLSLFPTCTSMPPTSARHPAVSPHPLAVHDVRGGAAADLDVAIMTEVSNDNCSVEELSSNMRE